MSLFWQVLLMFGFLVIIAALYGGLTVSANGGDVSSDADDGGGGD